MVGNKAARLIVKIDEMRKKFIKTLARYDNEMWMCGAGERATYTECQCNLYQALSRAHVDERYGY